MKIILDKGAYMPVRAHDTDAGLDLRTPIDIIVPARDSVLIDTGVHVELPKKTAGFLKSKSGLNVRYGITSEGVIDVGYMGSIRAKLYNHSDTDYRFLAGDKITQLVIVPIVIPKRLEVVERFKDTERGNGGFGSSGK
jgi:dUTP pyrophosphatase